MAQSKERKKTPSANKTANKKRTGTKNRTANAKTKRQSSQRSQELEKEISFILFLVLCVLMFLSCFGVCGPFGNAISSVLFGLFGYLAYIVPIAMFAGVCFYMLYRETIVGIVKPVAGVIAVLSACGFLHGIIGDRKLETLAEVYRSCSQEHHGAGWLGAAVFGMLKSAFGTAGTFVVLGALLLIASVVISERSFVKGVKKSSSKVYHTAKEESEQRKVRREERRAKKRYEKDASGIDMGIKFTKEKKHPKKEESEYSELEETAREELVLSPEMAEIPVKGSFESAELPEETEEQESFKEQTEIPEEKKTRKSRKKDAGSENIEMPEITETQNQGKKYQAPPLRLLTAPKNNGSKNSAAALRETAAKLQQILKDFGVNVTVTDVSCGPTVTRYELQPDHGVKVSKVLSLADDIKLNLAVADIRIEAPIPGKAAIGIEVPNKENSTVTLRELLASDEFEDHASKLAFAVGKDIGGKTIIADIAKMPHLLIAGATGSGKSVCINTLIMSLLYKASPEDVKLIMIDPKVVELSTYNGIPHLLIPVVTDPKKAAGALNWAVAEMTKRYQLFAEYQVRNLQGYNEKVKSIEMLEDENKPQKLPQIVIIVDELADLMMVAPGEVEDAICRLAQLARAAGIHLIIATQRPSVNVITGLIKANMPSRLAFAVSSGVDSRTILDMNGAEKLLGKGDMLFYPYGYPKPVRIQGAFVSDEEVNAVVEFLKVHNDAAAVNTEIEEHMKTQQVTNAGILKGGEDSSNGKDVLFAEAGKFIIEKDKASIGMLQRWFKIGFNRAARIMDQLSEAGVVGEEQGTKPREVLMSMEQFEQYIEESL